MVLASPLNPFLEFWLSEASLLTPFTHWVTHWLTHCYSWVLLTLVTHDYSFCRGPFFPVTWSIPAAVCAPHNGLINLSAWGAYIIVYKIMLWKLMILPDSTTAILPSIPLPFSTVLLSLFYFLSIQLLAPRRSLSAMRVPFRSLQKERSEQKTKNESKRW